MEKTLYDYLFVIQWPWWSGGICIGLLVPGMYFFFNKALGVSTGYGSFLKLLLPQTKLSWFNSSTFTERFDWRLFFLAGIIIGAYVSGRLSGQPLFTLEMGKFTQLMQWKLPVSASWFFAGGLLLGLGSRISGGCTSGHSIHGLANLHLSSFVATVLYLIFGALTVRFIGQVMFGGM